MAEILLGRIGDRVIKRLYRPHTTAGGLNLI
jgi:hypothetical protein